MPGGVVCHGEGMIEWNIAGKTVLITGGTTGIGRATVEELAARGARVIFTARSASDGDDVCAAVRSASPDANVEHRELHLDDLASVRTFAAQLRSDLSELHVLVNNAGLSLSERRTTTDGFEMMFGVNHLGHFLLVEELRDLLEASSPSRIVTVASDAHRFGGALRFDDLQSEQVRFGAIGGLKVYGRSKLANMLHVRELSRRLEGSGVTANSLHPGFVRTRIARDTEATPMGERFVWPIASRFARSPERGASTSIYLACDPEVDGVTGRYFVDEQQKEPHKLGSDDAAAAQLWDASLALVS